MSEHRNNPTDRGPLTSWRRQTERLVRTPEEFDRPRPTHSLETADRGTCQDTKRIRPIEAHSHPGDGRQRDLSGHRNNPTDRGPLTNWRRQTEGLVRTPKETDRPRPTHILEMADRGTCQDTETIRPIEAHLLPGDGRQRDLSGHRINPTDRGPLTLWRWQTERLIRTPKQSDRPRPTHFLETADRAACQDTERIRPTEAHSPTGDGRQRDLSGHRRIRPTEAHSPTGDGRQRDLSGHRKNSTDRGPLTFWRRQAEGLVRTRKEDNRPSDGYGHSQAGKPRGKAKSVYRNNVQEWQDINHRNQRVECGLETVHQSRIIHNKQYNSPRSTERPSCIILSQLLCS